MTSPACSRSRPGSRSRLGAITLWTTRRTDDRLRLRATCAALLLASAAVAAAYRAAVPALPRRTCSPTRRGPACRAPQLGAAYEQVAFRTSDGLSMRGWYVPSRNGAAVIAAPGRAGSQRPARRPRAARLRRPALRPARRGRERGRPERLRLGRRPRPPRRGRVPAAARDVDPGASAGSASRSAARRCSRPPPSRTD